MTAAALRHRDIRAELNWEIRGEIKAGRQLGMTAREIAEALGIAREDVYLLEGFGALADDLPFAREAGR